MKRIYLLALVMLLLFAASTQAVYAQSDTPPTPTSPLGEIRGTVINRNSGNAVTESLEVMLHVLDLNYVDQDMVH